MFCDFDYSWTSYVLLMSLVGYVLRLWLFLDTFFTLDFIGRLCSVILAIPRHILYTGVIGRLCSVIVAIPRRLLCY